MYLSATAGCEDRPTAANVEVPPPGMEVGPLDPGRFATRGDATRNLLCHWHVRRKMGPDAVRSHAPEPARRGASAVYCSRARAECQSRDVPQKPARLARRWRVGARSRGRRSGLSRVRAAGAGAPRSATSSRLGHRLRGGQWPTRGPACRTSVSHGSITRELRRARALFTLRRRRLRPVLPRIASRRAQYPTPACRTTDRVAPAVVSGA